jgi:hypothetical protein
VAAKPGDDARRDEAAAARVAAGAGDKRGRDVLRPRAGGRSSSALPGAPPATAAAGAGAASLSALSASASAEGSPSLAGGPFRISDALERLRRALGRKLPPAAFSSLAKPLLLLLVGSAVPAALAST